MKITDSLILIKALGDSSRLLIINALMEKPNYLEELAERLNLAASTVSFHLKKLEQAKLIFRKKEQYYVVFHINEEIFNTVLKDIISLDNIDRTVQDERLRDYYSRVINTYFNNGCLIRIPSQTKKRLIILNEIIKKFTPGKQYKEKEVDEIIKTFHPDYCSIRRYFIDYRMMYRKNGIYIINPKFSVAEYTTDEDEEIQHHRNPNRQKVIKNNKTVNMENEKRKEIIKNYKQLPVPMGIYQLKNLLNGKILIGSTKNLKARKNREWMSFETNTYPVKELQDAWNEAGEKGVAFEIVDVLEPKKDEPDYNYTKDLQFLEELWLDKLQPYGEKGYNEIKEKKE
jgi:hypothetical protein